MKELKKEDALKLTRKRHPAAGIASFILAFISAALFITVVMISGNARGKLGIWAGGCGFFALVLSAAGVILAWKGLKQENIRPVFPSVGGILNILFSCFYIILYIWGMN